MIMLDANIILRYLLNDNEEMATEAETIIHCGSVKVTTEVIAEVVYVLKGVYNVEREKIATSLSDFIADVNITEKNVVLLALETFAKHILDFVDCILYAYSCIEGYEIKTYDKKLKKLLETI